MVYRQRDTDNDGVLDERLWATHDANFNITSLADDTGAVVERLAYDAFGAKTVYDADWTPLGASAFGMNYGFQGLRFDDVAGLSDARNRWYSPTLGRFVTNDPIRYEAGDVNLYRFVGNSPGMGVDPSGEITVKILQEQQGIPTNKPAFVRWDFFLNEPAKETGRIVQQNIVYWTENDCPDANDRLDLNFYGYSFSIPGFPDFDKLPAKRLKIYWEAWFVTKGGDRPFARTDAPLPADKIFYTDLTQIKFGSEIKKKGHIMYFGQIRFFPGVDIESDKRWGKGKVKDAGILWSTYDKPVWWDTKYDKDEGTASRWMRVKFAYSLATMTRGYTNS